MFHCDNPHCNNIAAERKKFRDPRRDEGYTERYFCSPDCELAIVDELERQAQYARLVN